jgi:5'-nucleotidase
MALMGFVEEKVDLVVSGINPDANLAQDLTYSGTVTAAIEAAIWGVAGIAVSLDLPVGLAEPDFNTAARVARQVISQVMAHNPLPELLLNINIPYLPAEQIKGVKITRQGKRIYRDELVKRIDPMGRPYYWIGGEPPTGLPEEGTDIGALAAGYVSVTPLHLSMTAYQALDKMKQWDWKLDLT